MGEPNQIGRIAAGLMQGQKEEDRCAIFFVQEFLGDSKRRHLPGHTPTASFGRSQPSPMGVERRSRTSARQN